MIRALAMGANEDSYWGEKQYHGFHKMVGEAEFHIKHSVPTLCPPSV
jgi:hypothetical protein